MVGSEAVFSEVAKDVLCLLHRPCLSTNNMPSSPLLKQDENKKKRVAVTCNYSCARIFLLYSLLISQNQITDMQPCSDPVPFSLLCRRNE